MSAKARITCLGEVMVEISLNDATPGQAGVSYAGDTFNTAIYLKRSAPDLNVTYASKIGHDRLSEGLRTMMRTEGLDEALMLTAPTRLPGLYAISTDEAGERSFLYWRDKSAARELFRAPALSLEALGQADLLYFSAISLAILPPEDRQKLLDWLPDYRAGGGRVAFDSNYRPSLWPDSETARAVIKSAWQQTDIGFPSLDDEIKLSGGASEAQILDHLHRLGVTSGALKRGARGPLALDGTAALDSTAFGAFPPAPRVIDSTAAGDSFNAAYLAAYLRGADTATCLRAGHDLAVRVIAHRGALLPRGAA